MSNPTMDFLRARAEQRGDAVSLINLIKERIEDRLAEIQEELREIGHAAPLSISVNQYTGDSISFTATFDGNTKTIMNVHASTHALVEIEYGDYFCDKKGQNQHVNVSNAINLANGAIDNIAMNSLSQAVDANKSCDI